jgi:hypothetical protein
VAHTVDICDIHFSRSLLGICGYDDSAGYWSLGSIVSSGENVQGDGVASINVVGVLFAARERKDRMCYLLSTYYILFYFPAYLNFVVLVKKRRSAM